MFIVSKLVYIHISANLLGGIVEDTELGTHEESLPVESHAEVAAYLGPLLTVETV